MAVNIIMEKSTFTGRDSSGKEHYRAVMLPDTTDELPAREWNGIVLEQGSSITSIGEGAEYLMNSAGAWVRQGGGGSSLPDVTTDDNGDVLTVVDGEWTKSTPQSPFKIVKASYADNTITFTNETQKSICEAIKNGQLVVVSTIVNTATNYSLIFNVASVNTNSSYFIVGFLSVHRESGIGTVYYEFSISDTSTSTTATLSSTYCNDYHSGGPI